MAIKNYTSGVDVYTSLGEIQGALAQHGARQIMVEYDDQGRPTGVAFVIDTPNGRRGFMLPANIDGVCQVLQRKKSRQTWHRRSVQAGATSGTGCWRKWRSSRPVW